MALRTVGVKLVAEVSDYTRKIQGAGKTTQEFTGKMSEAAKSGKLDAVADRAAVAGVALVGLAGTAIKLAADFDKSMAAVGAATHAGAKDLNALREAAIQAGKDTAYSATEAADAITELSKAGVSTSQILGGGLNGALSLAAAGQLDVGEAAETAASAMTQFRLSGSQVPHVADLLAAAAGKAQGSVSDVGYALSQSGLVAAQFGLSIEDTTGTLAAFANAGLIGSDAGTSLKTMFLALSNPAASTKKLMRELGIEAYDATGKFVGIADLAGQLKTKLGGLSQAQRDQALAQIFGNDAIRAANILYQQGSTGIQSWIGKVDDAGYASETAAKLTDNLAGDLDRLKGSLETMAIEAGGGANTGLRVLTKSANALVDQVGSLPPALTGTLTVMAAVGGGALLLGAGWVKLRRSTADMLTELREIGPGGQRAASALQGASKWAGRAAVAFAAYEVASTAVAAAQDDLNPQIEALGQGLQTYASTGKLAGESSRLLGADLGKLEGKFQFLADDGGRAATVRTLQGAFESLIPGLAGTDESLTRTKERVSALDASLSQMVQSGQAPAAQQAFDRLAKTLAVDGVSLDEFKKQFPQYAAAVETAGSATTKTTGAVDDMGTAAEQSADKIRELNKQLDDLVNQQLSADRASITMRDGQVALTKELKDGARTLSLGTEEGRKNRGAVLNQIDAIENLRKARVDEGESLDDANAKYVKDIEGLKKSMRQAGFSKKAINELVGAYEDLPSQVNTKVSVTGTGSVQNLLDSLLIKQQALKKGISLSAAASAFRKNSGSNIDYSKTGYHDGGRTPMVGEHQPAGVVHGQEFVFSAATVRKIDQQAPGFLDEAQATGQLPGYAGGGRVATWPFPMTVAKTMIPKPPPFTGDFGHWPSSPGAQRGDSGVWRQVVALIKSTGPLSGSFGNSYRPGDPLWHGSGRAVDWMGYNQDALATFLAGRRPLELIHRTRHRDYAYTRGVNKGSFNESLMEAHRNHVHIAMARGGTIREPIMGVGASGRTYSFGENYQPERVVPNWQGAGSGGGNTTVINLTAQLAAGANIREAGRQLAEQLQTYLAAGGSIHVRGEQVL